MSDSEPAAFSLPPAFQVDETKLNVLVEKDTYTIFYMVQSDPDSEEVLCVGGQDNAAALGTFSRFTLYLKDRKTSVILPVSFVDFADIFTPTDVGVSLSDILTMCIGRIAAIENITRRKNNYTLGVAKQKLIDAKREIEGFIKSVTTPMTSI